MNNDFEKYAKAIAEKALCDQKREEDDYMGADGLLYCGKCHTPKQYRVKGFSGDICPCVCQCVEKQREQDERARKIAANRQRCFPFMEQHKATFANDRGYNTAITQAMHNYVEHFETLRSHGKPGTHICAPGLLFTFPLKRVHRNSFLLLLRPF